MTTMLRITDLTKRYGRLVAVRDLEFEAAPGEAIALWGANGAGKTTVIRCVLGLLRYRGRIEVDGRDVRRSGRRARRLIGYVPQALALYDDLRVEESLHFLARLRGADRTRVAQGLDEVGLGDEHRRKRIGELSGGLKQRLGLALALISDPPLLILDEPTSNLDAPARASFLALLRLQRARGRTILFTSHRLEEVGALADRALVLEQGRLVLDCPGADLGARLGLGCELHVTIDLAAVEPALALLRARGFAARRNGCGLLVPVDPHRKAEPIRALAEGAIPFADFEIAEGGPHT